MMKSMAGTFLPLQEIPAILVLYFILYFYTSKV